MGIFKFVDIQDIFTLNKVSKNQAKWKTSYNLYASLQYLLFAIIFQNNIFASNMPTTVETVITRKQKINHDCYIFTFDFVNEKITFTIGQYFKIVKFLPTHQHPEGQELHRKYTPINYCSVKDSIDFLVKIYRPNTHPNYPHGGKYTPFLETQEVGDKLMVEGPFGRLDYEAGGIVSIDGEKHEAKRIFFIAGGSGITPIFQTIIQIAAMPEEKIQLILLFANRTEEDIVLRKELQAWGDRVQIHYILDHPPEGWKGYKGYITHEILKEICPLDDPATIYIHVGPAPMNKMIRHLFAEHYPKSVIFKF